MHKLHKLLSRTFHRLLGLVKQSAHMGLEHVNLVELFHTYAQPGRVEELRSEIDISRIPSWADFAMSIARSCKS